MEREFNSHDERCNGNVTTVNGSFSVTPMKEGDRQEVWINVFGPKGADRQILCLNWSDALLLAIDIIKAIPPEVSGAYQPGGVRL
jgi:hypothetical protein